MDMGAKSAAIGTNRTLKCGHTEDKERLTEVIILMLHNGQMLTTQKLREPKKVHFYRYITRRTNFQLTTLDGMSIMWKSPQGRVFVVTSGIMISCKVEEKY